MELPVRIIQVERWGRVKLLKHTGTSGSPSPLGTCKLATPARPPQPGDRCGGDPAQQGAAQVVQERAAQKQLSTRA